VRSGIVFAAAIVAALALSASAVAVRAPSHLYVVATTPNSVTYAWSRVGKARYATYRDGVRTGITRKPRRTYRGLFCGTTYRLGVEARTAKERSGKRVIRAVTAACPEPLFDDTGDLFVAPGGVDSGPCTQVEPCSSFDRAYQLAAPGEIVEVAGGRYPSQMIRAKATAAPNVVIREVAGQEVVVGDPGAETECIGFEGATYVTVEGFATPGYTAGGHPSQCGVSVGRANAHHVVLRDIDAGHFWIGADHVSVLGGDWGPSVDHNNKIEFAMTTGPRAIVVDGAVIHDFVMDHEHIECLALWGGHDVVVRNSHFYNCGVFHILLQAEQDNVGPDAIDGVLIEDNLFTQPDDSIGLASSIKVGDHGGRIEAVIRRNRVLADEVFLVQGFDGGGDGDITFTGNELAEPPDAPNGVNCMAPTVTTRQLRPNLVYTCGANVLAP
jgi:hypothetical protein